MPHVDSQPGARRKSVNRYKWATGVAVPILVAAFGMFKFAGGGKEQSTPNNFTIVTDVSVIENQYQQFTGKPLTDEALKRQVQSAVNLAKAGELDASGQIFEQIKSSVPVPAVFTNIAAIAAERGDIASARRNNQEALAKDPAYKPALTNRESLVRFVTPHQIETHGQEIEPNNDFNHANVIPVATKVAAAISAPDDGDFYQVKTPAGPRDIYVALVENVSTTLHPAISVYDGNRHQICQNYTGEPLARLECNFSGDSDSTYYVAVGQMNNTTGAYTVSLTGLKKFDRYEPNDDAPHATPLSLGTKLDANIMDSADVDFFVVKSSAAGQLTAHFENRSTSLHPVVTVYDGNRHQIGQNYSGEAVATLDVAFAAAAQSTYYVQVSPNNSTAGDYGISVK
jgi:hypothetical protein